MGQLETIKNCPRLHNILLRVWATKSVEIYGPVKTIEELAQIWYESLKKNIYWRHCPGLDFFVTNVILYFKLLYMKIKINKIKNFDINTKKILNRTISSKNFKEVRINIKAMLYITSFYSSSSIIAVIYYFLKTYI